MASMSPPPVDGEDDQASEPTKGLRLGDAERIAAERLAGADTTPERHVAEPMTPAIDAAPVAESRDEQWLGAVEPAPAAPPETSAPLPAEDAVASGIAATETAGGGLAIDPAKHLPADAVGALPGPAAAPASSLPVERRVEPLAGALDAAVRLTADATAAAEALESLQRLLQRQLPSVAGAPAPPAPRADADGWPPAAAPPPLPAPPAQDGGDNGRLSEHAAQLPPPDPARPMPAERRRFDVRGFFAGFALSWAFGVVLYLFMTAG